MEKVKQVYQNSVEKVKGADPKKRNIAIAVVVLVLAISIGTAFKLNKKEYNVLFTGLNDQEGSEIIGKLQEKGIAYKYEDGGIILVDSSVEEQIRAELVFEGYPKSGFTYDVFKDNISLMTTDFEKVKYELFELQDRIGATIRLFEGVRDAKVTIALGEERKYVLDANQKTDASASVVVIMEDGGSPSKKQVEGIKHLVARSIPDLKIENISVLDSEGKEVKDGEDTQTELSKLKTEMEKEIEKSVQAKVENVLAPFYGGENVRVSVKANLDINKRIRETINYAFPEWRQKTIALNEEGDLVVVEENVESARGIPSREAINQEFARDGEGTPEGVAGAETNADISIYGPAMEAQGNENYIINQNEIDYLVNQIKEQTQIDTGTLEDLRVSVSLNNTNGPGLAREEVIDLVGNAAGILKENYENQVTVVQGAFFNPDAPIIDDEEAPSLTDQYRIWIIGGVIALVLAVIITLVAFIILRKRKKKKQEEMNISIPRPEKKTKSSDEPQELQLPQELLAISNEKSVELRDQIREFAGNNPEISAQLIRSWLRGEGADE